MKKNRNDNKELKTTENTTRRRVLKTLAAGAGAAVWHSSLPQTWVKPIIESVTLPAHAQTSAPLTLSNIEGTAFSLRLVEGHSATGSITVSATGSLSGTSAGMQLHVIFKAYHQAAVTDSGHPEKRSGTGRLLSAVADTFVSSAFAAAEVICTQTATVSVRSDGTFTAGAVLSCGPGIVQVVAELSSPPNTARVTGKTATVLDVPGCNPCSESSASGTTVQKDCDIILMFNNTTEATMTALPSGDTLSAGRLTIPAGMTGIRVNNNIALGPIKVQRTTAGSGPLNEILEITTGGQKDYIIGTDVQCGEILSVSVV